MPHQLPRKPRSKLDNPEQSKQFIDMAREVSVDEGPEAFDRAFEKIDIFKATSELDGAFSRQSSKKDRS